MDPSGQHGMQPMPGIHPAFLASMQQMQAQQQVVAQQPPQQLQQQLSGHPQQPSQQLPQQPMGASHQQQHLSHQQASHQQQHMGGSGTGQGLLGPTNSLGISQPSPRALSAFRSGHPIA